MKNAYIILPAIILILIISGCSQQSQPSPSPVIATQSATPSPTSTPEQSVAPTQSIQPTQEASTPTPQITPQATPLTRKTSYSIVNSIAAQINISEVKITLNGKAVNCDPVLLNIPKTNSSKIDVMVTGIGNFVLENVLNEYYATKNGAGVAIGGGIITPATDVEFSEIIIGSSKCALAKGEYKASKGVTNILDVKGTVKSGPVELSAVSPTPTPSPSPTSTPVPTSVPVQREFEFSIQLNNDFVDTFCPGNTYIVGVDAKKGQLSIPGTFKISQGSISTEINITNPSSCSVANKTCSASLQASGSLVSGQTARLSFIDLLGTGGVNLNVIAC